MYKLAKNLHKKRLGGYSLIEVLIVVVIIGLLVSFLMLRLFARAERESRDAIRVDTMKAFESALDAYYSQYGMYPCGDASISDTDDAAYGIVDGTADSPGSCPTAANPSLEKIQRGFLNGVGVDGSGNPLSVPNCTGTAASKITGLYGDGFFNQRCISDPRQGQTGYTYLYVADNSRQNYLLATYLEGYTDLMANDGGKCDFAYEKGPLAGIVFPWWVGPEAPTDACPKGP